MDRPTLVSQLRFADAAAQSDLLNSSATSDGLIDLLSDAYQAAYQMGLGIYITAVRSDHPTYDGGPSGTGHNAGDAADLWLVDMGSGAYLSASDARFTSWLRAIAGSANLSHAGPPGGVGLGGSAQTSANYAAIGSVGFTDNGSDHIHLGAVGSAAAVNDSNPFEAIVQAAESGASTIANAPFAAGQAVGSAIAAPLLPVLENLAPLFVGLAFFGIGALLLAFSWGERIAGVVEKVAGTAAQLAAKVPVE